MVPYGAPSEWTLQRQANTCLPSSVEGPHLCHMTHLNQSITTDLMKSTQLTKAYMAKTSGNQLLLID